MSKYKVIITVENEEGMLNSTKMYCEKCKNEIEKFVEKKEEGTDEDRDVCNHRWEWCHSECEVPFGKCHVTYRCTVCGEEHTHELW